MRNNLDKRTVGWIDSPPFCMNWYFEDIHLQFCCHNWQTFVCRHLPLYSWWIISEIQHVMDKLHTLINNITHFASTSLFLCIIISVKDYLIISSFDHLFTKNSEFNYLTRKNSEGCSRCRYPPPDRDASDTVQSLKLDFRIYWPENFKIRIFI